MTFAPSADPTDATARHDLYVADAGTSSTSGGVTEITLAAQPLAALAVTNQTASLVQVIQTSRFSPPSPDPSGIAWLPGPDRLLIVDSEVEEVTGAGYHGVNLWQATRGGTVVDTGTLYPAVSKEPTGTDYDPGTGTLFVSDDSKGGVHVIRPGLDGRFGSADDVVRFIGLSSVGSGDTEDPAFDTTTGHLYVSDAISAEIFEVDPVNGVFGDGNDLITHFDVGRHGVVDGEGLAFDSTRNTLLVGDRSSRRIYEISKSNELVRVIDARVAGLTVLSGLTVAPAIDDPARRDYWIVDRAVDNGPNPGENDGKIFEVSAPAGPVDAPPTVSFASPGDGATVSGANVTVQASASDDVGVTQVQFFDGTASIGVDTVAGDGWSVTWDTTSAIDGPHTLRATATDTAGQTATATRSVTVMNGNANSPPTVAISSPAPNTTVSGANVTVQASASDDVGVTQVQFFDGTASIGVDTVAGDGWSVTWDTTSAIDGPHTLTARATDTGGLSTTSAAVPVTVRNGVLGTTTVLDVPITNGNDDVEERLSDGRVDRASNDLDMMLDNTTVQSAIGLRFVGLTIPRGAVVTSAYVQFRADESWADPTTLSISGIASDNAPLFPTGRFSLSGAARTQTSGSWSPAGWVERNRGPDQRTTNIAAILQELIDRPGWKPGNAVALVITGSGRRVAKSFEAGATSAPVLHVEYTVVSGS
ncbi:MAG: hypothetical protein KatS3mg010_0258 [Acidimicrobiia bacterium]|nr:MAG: hypothetical protein KatS3mg010_0258 [Acidimicrobiia bacterium]